MALVPRNSPCPCGSGIKYKCCCIERERALAQRAEALEELLALPALFPLLRPAEDAFEQWADEQAGMEPTRELIEEGGSLLSDAERERIRRAHADEFPDVWRSLVRDFGDEGEAEETVLVGAVVAALREVRELDDRALELVEIARDLRADPAKALAIVLDDGDLWSLAEMTLASDALVELDVGDGPFGVLFEATLTQWVAQAWSPAHERRLELLVGRVRARLPVAGRRTASRVLKRACAAFERDPAVRRRLALLLLTDTLGALRLRRLYELLAA